ncbi:hypothetical protein OpiT1DRAFT_01232 [Opitutaceae bacterium TAV1]|nr:hypothetical protein OpiT1DRAFT_01232 [Opitutaceae bacterium TAV1]
MGDFFSNFMGGLNEIVSSAAPVAQTWLQADAAKDAAKAAQQAAQTATTSASAQQSAAPNQTTAQANKVLLIVGGIGAFAMLVIGVVLVAIRRR